MNWTIVPATIIFQVTIMQRNLMKLRINLTCIFFALLMAPIVWAHEGHDHTPVSMKSAIEIALKAAKRYTKTPSSFDVDKLPLSWAQVGEANASIFENGRGYYVVSIVNPAEAKTIYIKIRLDGAVIGATYTADFIGVSANSSSGK
jgi:hypothetical protein